jgi:hypothetical protein
MFERVDMHIIDVSRIVSFIANRILSESPLPNAAFAFRARAVDNRSVFGSNFANAILIAFQHAINMGYMEWPASTDSPHGFTEGVDMFDQ